MTNGLGVAISKQNETCGLFFFQAEDGIRDVAVTGVQTCALPISWLQARMRTLRVLWQPSEHGASITAPRSEEHTSELQSRLHLVCRLLLEKNTVRNRAARAAYPGWVILPGTLRRRVRRRDGPRSS